MNDYSWATMMRDAYHSIDPDRDRASMMHEGVIEGAGTYVPGIVCTTRAPQSVTQRKKAKARRRAQGKGRRTNR